MLDSIAGYAAKNGLPVKTALGIAVKESTLGNFTDDGTFYKLFKNKKDREYFKNLHDRFGTVQHINKGEPVGEWELINMWRSPNPYYDALSWANKHAKSEVDFKRRLAEGEKYADKQTQNLIKSGELDKSILDAGFQFYKKDPYGYNPGQANYPQLVDTRANELWNSPEIQSWYKNSNWFGYEDGKDSVYPVLAVKHGSKVNTDQCATWSNSWLRDNGYITHGNAWNLKGVDTLFNGFEGLQKPSTYDRAAIEQYNHDAADSVYKNFDSSTLDKSKPYAVNMFYNGSPALQDAYNNGDSVSGTHTGILTFNPDENRWYVTHNIHGTIYQEPFVPLQNGKGKYGVTAIYKPRKKNLVNRVKDVLGFKDGKDSIYIKPSKRGTFTAAAKRRGMSVAQLESAVLNNPSNYSKAMRKKAQFSRNARKWHK